MHWLMTTLAKYEERMERRQVRHFLMGAVFAALAVAGQAQVAAAQGVRIVSNTTGRCLDLPEDRKSTRLNSSH